jgi:hypothetical protein
MDVSLGYKLQSVGTLINGISAVLATWIISLLLI